MELSSSSELVRSWGCGVSVIHTYYLVTIVHSGAERTAVVVIVEGVAKSENLCSHSPARVCLTASARTLGVCVLSITHSMSMRIMLSKYGRVIHVPLPFYLYN